MGDTVLDKRKPEPPKPAAYIASLLELGMLAVFSVKHSWAGLILWLVYFYYSATLYLLASLFRKDG